MKRKTRGLLNTDNAVIVRGTVSPGEEAVWMPLVGEDFRFSFSRIYPAPDRQHRGEVSVSLVDRGLRSVDLCEVVLRATR